MCHMQYNTDGSLGENAKAHAVAVAGPWLADALQKAGAGLDTETAVRCCKPCKDFYQRNMKGNLGIKHPLLDKKHARVRPSSVIVVTTPFENGGVNLVRCSVFGVGAPSRP